LISFERKKIEEGKQKERKLKIFVVSLVPPPHKLKMSIYISLNMYMNK
jgi:hypothetical protein